MTLWETFKSNIGLKKIFLIDIGGYKGEFTDNFIQNIDNIGDVHIYEPQENSFLDLENKYSDKDNIKIFNIAIGNEKGRDTFYFDNNAGYNSSLLKPLVEGFETIDIETNKLDNIYLDIKDDAKFVLKIDTQGNDLNVLKGSTEFIEKKKPIIFCELIYVPLYDNQAFAHEIIMFLDKLGYVLARLEDMHETKNGILAYADGLFIHKDQCKPDCICFELHKDSYCLNLEDVCEERLDLINRLDKECKRLAK